MIKKCIENRLLFYSIIKHNIKRDHRRLIKYKSKIDILENKRRKGKNTEMRNYYNKRLLSVHNMIISVKSRIGMFEMIRDDYKRNYLEYEKEEEKRMKICLQ